MKGYLCDPYAGIRCRERVIGRECRRRVTARQVHCPGIRGRNKRRCLGGHHINGRRSSYRGVKTMRTCGGQRRRRAIYDKARCGPRYSDQRCHEKDRAQQASHDSQGISLICRGNGAHDTGEMKPAQFSKLPSHAVKADSCDACEPAPQTLRTPKPGHRSTAGRLAELQDESRPGSGYLLV